MSSLLQFNGKIERDGVHLQFVHVLKNQPFAVTENQIGDTMETDGIYTPDGAWHARIWTAKRKPAGMFGPWVLWRVNGELHPFDLSCPIGIERLPRDARPLPIDECLATWKS